MRRNTLGALVALLLLAAGSCRAAGDQAPATRAAASAPVLVAIVIDQMAAWIADQRWGLLPKGGGFGRLTREGTLVRRLRFAHACTDTAPGHAALFTGATPRASGIFANEWVDESGRPVSMLADPDTKLITAQGPQGAAGVSLRALRAETLADLLRRARPEATIASVSLKDRGAVFGGGRRPDLSLWFDRSRGTFATSTAFATEWPSWLPASAARPLAGVRGDWTLLDAAYVQSHAATVDAAPGEGDLAGLGVTFPHPRPRPGDAASAFRVLPQSNEVLVDLALAVLDRHRAEKGRDAPLLLSLSLSTNDYVGHVFGPDSYEAWDQLRRLDGTLARLFAGLDARLGADGWAAMLSGDHGVATMPEALDAPQVAASCSAERPSTAPQRSCAPGERVATATLRTLVDHAAAAALGDGRWIAGVSEPYVYYSADAEALAPERRATLDAAVSTALSSHPAVAHAVPTSALPSHCPGAAEGSVDALVCEAVPPDAPGDVYFFLRPGSFVDVELVEGKGSNHGSPHDYDRTVPLVVRAPGRVTAGRRIDAPLDFRAFARTGAALLGIDPPEAARGGVDLTNGSPVAPATRPPRG